MTGSDRSIRASDADRESVAASLRDHYAAGRLNGDEFNERLDKAYAATTLGDLADLQADLPAPQPAQPPVSAQSPVSAQPLVPAQSAGPVAAGSGQHLQQWRGAFGSWLSVSLVCFVIWLLSGASGSLWFLWPSGILGALLLARVISGTAAPSHDRLARRDYRRSRRGF